MQNKNTYIQKLEISDAIRKPVIQSVLDFLQLPQASQGLDIGCGTGRDCYVMSKLVGENGFVHGIDMTENQIERISDSTNSYRVLYFRQNCLKVENERANIKPQLIQRFSRKLLTEKS